MKVLVALITMALFTSVSFAEETKEEYEEVFFREDVVETVTKRAEKVEEVPAFVSIMKREEILNYGFLDLYRVLAFQPGIEVVESFFGYSEVVIRGVYPTHYNNKSLFLIDQYPVYEPVNGSFHLEFIPMGAIERVEIIRGPGSSIYGTNAFTGIINVIPRNGRDIDGFEIDVLAGVHEDEPLTRALISYGGSKNGLDYFLSGEVYYDSGYNFKAVDERGGSREIDYKNTYGNFMWKLSGNNYKIIFGYFNQEKMKFGIIPVWATNGENTYEGFYAEGLLKGEISEKVRVTFRTGYNNLQRLSYLDGLSGYTYPSFPAQITAPRILMISGGDVLRSELTGDVSVTDSFSLLAGGVFERQHTDPYIFIDRERKELHSKTAFLTSGHKENYGVYLEGAYSHKFFKIYAGGRYDYDTRRDVGRITPRAGIVVKPLEKFYVKAVYGEAFRYPNFFEYDVFTTNVLIGNPHLKEEFIRSIDFGIEGSLFGRIKYSLLGYFEDVHDLITREPSPRRNEFPDEFWYINKGGVEVWGGELSISARPVKRLDIIANGTIRNGSLEEVGKIPYFSKHLFNIGLILHLPWNLHLSPTWSLIGRREKVIEELPDNTTRTYNIFNIGISYEWKGLAIRALALNLTGENIKYPDHIRGKVFIPGESNPSFYGEVGYKF